MNTIDHAAFSAQPVQAFAKPEAEAPTPNQGYVRQTLPEDAVKPQAEPPKRAHLSEAVSHLKEFAQRSERALDFQVDDASGQTVIRVYDKQSDDLIRQIPGELALKLAERLNDDEPSLLFSAHV